MSLIGQAVRDGFKDTVLKIVEQRIGAVERDCSLSIATAILILEELRSLKKKISDLDTE